MKLLVQSIISFAKNYPLLLVAFIGMLFFLPGLGGVNLFDWDEINFAEASREMLLTGDWLRVQIDFSPFWEKPPLFFWLQASSMYLLGINEYAARLPNAIIGIISLVILFQIGRKWHGTTFGFLWAGAYLGSVLPSLYFKSGIIDPWFNIFIFLGLYQFICFHWRRNEVDKQGILKHRPHYYLFWSGIFIGMAILTKGPVSVLLILLTLFAYWVYQRFKLFVSIPSFLFFCFSASLVGLLWFGIEYYQNGSTFIAEFIKYQYRLLSTADAGHKGFWGFHIIVLLIGCFPASIFAIPSLFGKPTSGYAAVQVDLNWWMKFLFWVVLVVFSLVQSKIVHYSSLCYFPLTYFAAWTITDYVKGYKRSSSWIQVGLFAVGFIYVAVTIIAPWLGQNVELLHPLLEKDPFAMANLEADVFWSGWEILPGLLLISTLVLGIIYLRKQKYLQASASLFLGMTIFIQLSLYFYINNIESYSQRAAIDFFKSKQGEQVYVTTYGYKSYAHLYYSQKEVPTNKMASNKDWLLNGDIDRDVFIVSKINRAAPLLNREDIKIVGKKNGFVFLLRDSKK